MTKGLFSGRTFLSLGLLALPFAGNAACSSDSTTTGTVPDGSVEAGVTKDGGASGGAATGGRGAGGAAVTAGGAAATTGGAATASGGSETADASSDGGDGGPGTDETDGGGDAGDAGPLALGVSLNHLSAAISPGGTTDFIAVVSNDGTNGGVTWSVDGPGSVDANGHYTAPAGADSVLATVTATSVTDPSKTASAKVYVVAHGTVATTAHPMVAKYSVTPPAPAKVEVQFGADTAYGKSTSATTSAGGAGTAVLVAGMPGAVEYHLRGVVTFDDGTQFFDADDTFTNGAAPAVATATATVTSGKTPTPGIELVSSIAAQPQALAIDLSGNVVWYYNHGGVASLTQPIKPLPNGHFIVVVGPNSAVGATGIPPAGKYVDALREIDLTGTVIRSLTREQLTAALPAAYAAGCAECNFTPVTIHHEVLELPNGHMMLMVSVLQQDEDGGGNILGDAIVDLDADWKPVWAWNAFNHLDVNRRPYLFPDWTHANALTYSDYDGSVLMSVRHQSWVIKIDYDHGHGDGHVVWRLGLDGDFTLVDGTEPHDWFNAEHSPSIVGTQTSNVFSLTLFDNGTYRPFSAADPCGTAQLPCSYSTVPIYEIDETAKTAKLVYNFRSPSYSFWGGNAEVLPSSGNVHFDVSQPIAGVAEADVYEVTRTATPEIVMRLNIKGVNAYRSMRIGSLYPGVTW